MKPRYLVALILCAPLAYFISSGPVLHYSFSASWHPAAFRFYHPIVWLKFQFPDSVGVVVDGYWKICGLAVKRPRTYIVDEGPVDSK